MNSCKGCGIALQNDDISKPGYTKELNNEYCERCFRITNYNDHKIDSQKLDNENIIKSINSKKTFTLFLIDFLSLNNKNINLYNKINNDKILVITKSDIIPKNVVLDKIEKKIKTIYQIKNLMFFSKKNGYGKNRLTNIIENKQSIIICGPTNGGKSSLINYLYDSKLTISNYKNTTQDFISLKINDLNIIDAPGFNDEDIIDNIKQSGYITPKTVKLNKNFVLKIFDYEIYSNENINVTLFFPNNIKYNSYKQKEVFDKNIKISDNIDLLINNVGFIHFKNKTEIFINKIDNIETRNTIIG